VVGCLAEVDRAAVNHAEVDRVAVNHAAIANRN